MTGMMAEKVARAIYETWAHHEACDVTWEDLCAKASNGLPYASRWRDLAFKEANAAMESMGKHEDAGVPLALYIELSSYFDPKLTEHDKSIILSKIRSRTSVAHVAR